MFVLQQDGDETGLDGVSQEYLNDRLCESNVLCLKMEHLTRG